MAKLPLKTGSSYQEKQRKVLKQVMESKNGYKRSNWQHQPKVGVADLLTRPGAKPQILASAFTPDSSRGVVLSERPDEAGARRLRDLKMFSTRKKRN